MVTTSLKRIFTYSYQSFQKAESNWLYFCEMSILSGIATRLFTSEEKFSSSSFSSLLDKLFFNENWSSKDMCVWTQGKVVIIIHRREVFSPCKIKNYELLCSRNWKCQFRENRIILCNFFCGHGFSSFHSVTSFLHIVMVIIFNL